MQNTSLYIHWPFCKAKCPYCDFNSHVRDTPLEREAWHNAYLKELDYYADFLKGKTITSIYFGGGTPSLMPPALVEALIDKAAQLATVKGSVEITLEANPTSVEVEKLKDFKLAGINRVSMGIQSLNDDYLKFLGREHSASEALKALDIAANLFKRHTFDLIYALPEQSLKTWTSELNHAINLMNGHASLYQLTIEKGTPFYSQHHKGEFTIPDEDLAADMYELTNEFMGSHGYDAYEISNYAKPNHESQHNLNYWRYGDYIGIGAGAHGRLSSHTATQQTKEATFTTHTPEKWLSQVQEKGNGIQQRNKLSDKEMLEEILMFGLRLEEGVDLKLIEQYSLHNIEKHICYEQIETLSKEGLICKYDSVSKRLALTSKGRMMLHSVMNKFLI